MRLGARTSHVCFAHWPVAHEGVQSRLPHALSVATRDGVAWVSMLAMRTRPLAGAVALPGAYAQVTLRTYVETEDGTGVHFLRIDADGRLAALGGRRVFGLPYHHVDTRVEPGDGEVEVRTQANDGTPLFVGAFAVPEELTLVGGDSRLAWLTDRDTYVLGDGRTGRVEHDTWGVGATEVDILRNDLFASEGLPEPVGDPLLGYSPGADFHLAEWPS